MLKLLKQSLLLALVLALALTMLSGCGVFEEAFGPTGKN